MECVDVLQTASATPVYRPSSAGLQMVHACARWCLVVHVLVNMTQLICNSKFIWHFDIHVHTSIKLKFENSVLKQILVRNLF